MPHHFRQNLVRGQRGVAPMRRFLIPSGQVMECDIDGVHDDEFVSVLSSSGEDETRVESRHELTVSIQNREKRGSLQVVVRKKTTFASRIESVTYTLLYIAHHYIAHLHRNILFNNYG